VPENIASLIPAYAAVGFTKPNAVHVIVAGRLTPRKAGNGNEAARRHAYAAEEEHRREKMRHPGCHEL